MKKTIAFVSALIAFALFAVTACAHEAKSTVKHNPQYTKWDIFEPPDNTSVGSWTCHSAENNITVGYGDLSSLQGQDQGTFKTYIGYAISQWKRAGSINMSINNNPVVNSNNYLVNLINNGFYNFTRNFEGINFLYNNPNSFENVQHLITATTSSEMPNNNLGGPSVAATGVAGAVGMANQAVNNVQPSFNQPVGQPVDQNNNEEVYGNAGMLQKVFSNRMIIGIQNVTAHAGASTLVRMMVRQLNNHGIKAYGIEMFRQDLMYYRDPHLVACMNRNDIERELRKMEDGNAVIMDLNDFGEADKYCDKVIYLIEPSFIKLTKCLKKNSNALVELRDANVVLNMSFVNNQELPDFEYETKLTIFDNIPPLNDRNENSIEVNNFLRKLGYNIVDSINNQ